MQPSRLKKTSYNIMAQGLYELVNFAVQLILPSLIIRNYGSAYNGLIASITQFLKYISVLTLGIAGPTRVALYKSLAENDIQRTSAIVNAHANYMRKVGMVLIGYTAMLCIIFPIITDSQFSTYEIVFLTIAIGIESISNYFLGITYTTLLTADQRLYVYNLFKTIITTITFVVSFILIYCSSTLQIIKLVAGFIFLVGMLFFSQKTAKEYHVDKTIPPDYSAIKQRKDALGHSVANIIHESTDVAVITLMCNVSMVSVYSVYSIVINGLKQLLNIFTVGIEAVFGNMIAKGEKDKLLRGLSCFELLIGIFVSVVFSVSGVLIIPFVSLYTKGVTDVKYIIPAYAITIISAQAFYCIRMPYVTLVQAAGHYKQTKYGAYMEAIINIVSSIILTVFWGIIGTAIGTLLANVFRTVQYAVYTQRNLAPRKISIFVKRLVWIVISILATVIISYSLSLNQINSWKNWLLCGAVITFLAFIISIINALLLFKQDMVYVISLMKRFLKK